MYVLHLSLRFFFWCFVCLIGVIVFLKQISKAFLLVNLLRNVPCQDKLPSDKIRQEIEGFFLSMLYQMQFQNHLLQSCNLCKFCFQLKFLLIVLQANRGKMYGNILKPVCSLLQQNSRLFTADTALRKQACLCTTSFFLLYCRIYMYNKINLVHVVSVGQYMSFCYLRAK